MTAAERAARTRELEQVVRVRWTWLVRDIGRTGLTVGAVVLLLPLASAARPLGGRPLGLGLAVGGAALAAFGTARLWAVRPRSPQLAGLFSRTVVRGSLLPVLLALPPAITWTQWVSTASSVAVWFGALLAVGAVVAGVRLHHNEVELFRYDAEERLGLRTPVVLDMSRQQVMERSWGLDDRPCGRP